MKIIAGNKMSLIIKREEGAEYADKIQHISSTEEQPYMGINFMDGNFIGGRTMSEIQVNALVGAAKKAGLKIEE